jgi:hypothetical protein
MKSLSNYIKESAVNKEIIEPPKNAVKLATYQDTYSNSQAKYQSDYFYNLQKDGLYLYGPNKQFGFFTDITDATKLKALKAKLADAAKKVGLRGLKFV